ncbi:MAG: hypothetical protein HWE10_00860 [Gammaproteobacteria bacterium]|nr:hypothetical protein [Gammaproteobacteria bacterium]
MNKVTISLAGVINQHLRNGNVLGASEFMTDAHMPFDQQDRIFAAISHLKKPSESKISIIIEQAGLNPDSEWLCR